MTTSMLDNNQPLLQMLRDKTLLCRAERPAPKPVPHIDSRTKEIQLTVIIRFQGESAAIIIRQRNSEDKTNFKQESNSHTTLICF